VDVSANPQRTKIQALTEVSIRCGGRHIYEPDGISEDTKLDIRESPGYIAGEFRYSLEYERVPASMSTSRRVAQIPVPSGDPQRLTIARRSRPFPARLLKSTSEVVPLVTTSLGPSELRLGRVVAATGDRLLRAGDACEVVLKRTTSIFEEGRSQDTCAVVAVCGGEILVGEPETYEGNCRVSHDRIVTLSDPKPGSVDNDPALFLSPAGVDIWDDVSESRFRLKIAFNHP
jgi:hypothetical protein